MAKKARSRSGKTGASARDALVVALLDEAAAVGWRDLALAAVAERAGMTLGALLQVAPSKAHLLGRLFAAIDAETLAPVTAPDPADTPRDRLFEVLMRRFDALNRHRAGTRAVIRGLARDPAAAAMSWCRFDRSGAAMLAAAGISADGLCGLARIQGLKAIHLAALRAWMKDDSADLAATMAALDRALRQAERLLAMVPGLRRRDAAAETA